MRVGGGGRLAVVILEVADLDGSARLYRDGFGLDLQTGDNGGDDRWIGGAHAEMSYRDGAYLHFALFGAKEQPTTGAQIGWHVADLASAHARAVAAGADVVHGPRTEPWGETSRYRDLDGNVVSLTQPSR